MAATTVMSKAARKAHIIRLGNTIFKFGTTVAVNDVSSAAGFGPLPSRGCCSSAAAITALRLVPSLGIATQYQNERRESQMYQDMDRMNVPKPEKYDATQRSAAISRPP
jgi:hypothetical protein